MKKFRIGLIIIGIVSIVQPAYSDKPNVCKCPNNVDGAVYPYVMCGKELNFINGNQNCEMEGKYRCRSGGKETEVVDICKTGKVCGRDYGICRSAEDCLDEKRFRMCYTVDGTMGGPRSRCHKMHYELDDKGKLCCDKVYGQYKLPECRYH